MDAKKRKKFLVLATVSWVLVTFSLNSAVFSSEYLHVKTSGFTRLPVSARALGMGEAFVAVADDYSSCHYNPAGLVHLNSRSFSSMYVDLYGLGLLTHSYFSFVEPNTGLGSGGISWSHLVASFEPERWYADLIAYSYAKKLFTGENVGSWGINLKYLRESTPWEDATGYSIDLAYLQRGEKLSWGICIKDVMSKIDWDTGRKENIPFNLITGFASKISPHLLLAIDIEGSSGDIPKDVRLGTEWKLQENFSLRAGVIKKFQQENDINFAVGAGFKTHFSKVKNISFDYAFLSSEIFPSTHYISFSLAF